MVSAIACWLFDRLAACPAAPNIISEAAKRVHLCDPIFIGANEFVKFLARFALAEAFQSARRGSVQLEIILSRGAAFRLRVQVFNSEKGTARRTKRAWQFCLQLACRTTARATAAGNTGYVCHDEELEKKVLHFETRFVVGRRRFRYQGPPWERARFY